MTNYDGLLVSDQFVQAAFDWLKDNSASAAKAKADRIRSEYRTKQVRAEMFLSFDEGTVAEKEAKALASEEYNVAVEAEARAVELDEYHRNQRSKAEAIIEAWRSEQANMRAMTKVG